MPGGNTKNNSEGGGGGELSNAPKGTPLAKARPNDRDISDAPMPRDWSGEANEAFCIVRTMDSHKPFAESYPTEDDGEPWLTTANPYEPNGESGGTNY